MGNIINCHRCGEPIDEWCETRRYGFWDSDAQNYENGPPIENRFCRECWKEREGRAIGAHYRPDTAQELYDVLEAADGKLAGILTWWTGRPAIRVVDESVEAARLKREDGGLNEEGVPILRFTPKRIDDFDRDEFDDVADPPEDRNIVYLRTLDKTPFADLTSPNY